MSWPHKEKIRQGVLNMLRINMSLKPSEKLLVVSDVPGVGSWQTATQTGLTEMLERAMLGRLISEIAAEHFADVNVGFLPFPATGGHGTEPDDSAAAKMREADVLICLTHYSLSHTNAREKATQAGARVASMPGFTHHMFAEGGPMAVDYRQIAADCQLFANLLTPANQVIVKTPYGTDLRFSIAGRPGHVDDGLYGSNPEKWGNLPAGEAYSIPVEGTGEGTLVALAGWYPGLKEDMAFYFEKGEVVKLTGGGAVGDQFRELLKLGHDDPVFKARRNLAELGIGTNPNARQPDNVLEAEKIKGTVHIAIGDNIHMGGQVESDLHEDFVQPQVDLLLDGQQVISHSTWQTE